MLRASTQEVDYVCLNDFMRQILPQSYFAKFPDIDDVIKQLEEDRALSEEDYWNEFSPQAQDADEPESDFRARSAGIVTAISKAATTVAVDPVEGGRAPPHLEYINEGGTNTESVYRPDISRPDGFFVLKNRAEAMFASEVLPWFVEISNIPRTCHSLLQLSYMDRR